MPQGRLTFDAAAARRARDDAIRRVGAHAPPDWRAAALAAVRHVAARRPYLTTDDVQRFMDAGRMAQPPEPRAWGAVMRSAARAGVVEKTDRRVASDQVACHRREKTVWRSLIHHPHNP